MQSSTKFGKHTLDGGLTGSSMECSLRPLPWGRSEDWLHQGDALPGALRYPVFNTTGGRTGAATGLTGSVRLFQKDLSSTAGNRLVSPLNCKP
ncbi:MAG: hypothetical protein FRX49_12520 [Trebouxia sp. A1-2]|nr:MAG: hypothetical protein FRX49_12520 [Trebouxia sp. A1-2]